MHFLVPGLLWGLCALSIPIIIHYFNFRRLRKEGFSNVAFLKNVQTQSKSFTKLKNWWVLAARLGFVVALVLAFAQPFLGEKGLGENALTERFGLYIDNSYSTQTDLGSSTMLNAQIAKATTLAKTVDKDQKALFFTNEFAGNETKLLNAKGLEQQIAKTTFSTRNRSLEDISNRYAELASSKDSPLLILSDFQKSTAGSVQNWVKAQTRPTYLIPFQANSQVNVFIDSVWLETPFVQKNVRNFLNVQLKNNGKQKANQVSVSLDLDGITSQNVPIAIEPASEVVQKIPVTFSKNGLIKGHVSINDKPLLFDNTFYFVVNTSPKIKIAHVSETAQNEFIKNAFANDSLFTYKAFSTFNINAGSLKEADLLVLENITNIDSNLAATIAAFRNGGGLLLIIPPSNANITSYATVLQQYGVSGFAKNKEAAPATMDESTLKESFFADIFESKKEKGSLQLPKATLAYTWNNAGFQQLLATKGKRPYISLKNTSKGSLALLASSLQVLDTDFGRNALFVPILYKLAYMSLRPQALANRFGSEASVFLPIKNVAKDDVLKMTLGKETVIPTQAQRADGVLLELPKATEVDAPMAAGFYDISLKGQVVRTIALNNSLEESAIDVYTKDELAELCKTNKVVTILSANAMATWVKESSKGKANKPLWKYFVYLALFFLLIEVLLLRSKR
jgi:hypothetical protein